MKVDFKKPGSVVTALLIFIMVVSINSCSKDSTTATPGPNEVFMQNTAFTPSTLTVAVNTTVTWTNKDNINHNVTGTGGSF
ncbi:MAG: hypothetical protein JWO03_1510, partial [Bacteroidetes bacterium]|nr:hypothetical protein [Bacteroidota bacterium]